MLRPPAVSHPFSLPSRDPSAGGPQGVYPSTQLVDMWASVGHFKHYHNTAHVVMRSVGVRQF